MQGANVLQGFVGAMIACVVAACIAVGTLTIVGVGKQQAVACQSVNALRTVLVQIVERSAKSIPQIAYYKTHPADLAIALQQVHSEEQVLQPVQC